MRAFRYERPTVLADTIELLAGYGDDARILAGGTDLIIRLRDRTLTPAAVVDVKRMPEFAPSITEADGILRISAGTTMTDIHDSPVIQRWFPALAEAARYVGSVQIRNRATLAGNQCNASPAADTAPPLLVYGAMLEIAGPSGGRSLALDDFFVRSGVTRLERGRAGDRDHVAVTEWEGWLRISATHTTARARPGVGNAGGVGGGVGRDAVGVWIAGAAATAVHWSRGQPRVVV